MKYGKLFIIPAVILMACGGNTATSSEAGDVAANNGEATTYVIDSTSNVAWKGGKLFSTDGHNGTFALSAGELSVADGNIASGSFTIDLTKIGVTDLTAETGAGDLIGHLSGADFFDVAKYPTAKFDVTKCEVKAEGLNTHVLTGNLTIKDSTRSVNFPIAVKAEGDNLTATGSVKINRIDWGISYDKNNQNATEKAVAAMKNGVVNNEVALTINLNSKKK